MSGLSDVVHDSTSSSLIRRAIRDDATAWHRLVRQYGPLAYNYARNLGLTPEESADVAQETLTAVYLSLNRFKREQETDGFRKWLRGIVRHKACDVVRDSAKRIDIPVGGSAMERVIAQLPIDPNGSVLSQGDGRCCSKSSASAEPSHATAMVRRALTLIQDDFSPASWKAFWETAVNGRNATEVSRELAMTSAAVRKAKSRVTQRLKEELERMG